jgi:hypothetical protein
MGLAVAPRHADGEKMTHSIRRVLSEPGFQQHARRVRVLYAGTDGAGRAAVEIRRYLGTRSEPPSCTQPESTATTA